MAGAFLLIGGDSEIAAATARHLRHRGDDVIATTRRRPQVTEARPFLDLAAPLGDWTPPPGVRAAGIFAAVARLQDCARDPGATGHVNVTQTLALIDRLRHRNIPVLFLSSDKVFDGSRPLVPADTAPCPASEYGRQKAAAEAALLRRAAASGPPIAILRLSKVVSPGMALLADWSRALAAGKAVRAFADLYAAPVPVALAAAAIADLLAEPARGIFQLSGPQDISYEEIARWLAQRLGAPAQLVTPVAAAEGMPPGATPRHTTLDSAAVCRRLGTAVPGPWEVLEPVVAAPLAAD